MKIRSEISTEDLIKLGLVVGKNFCRQEKTLIDQSHCWLITIGNNVTLAPRVHILAHDASTKHWLGYTKIGRVTIGNNVFIGAGTVVLPNVIIGDNCIIGANSVITKNIPEGTVAAGNPARVICTLDEYIAKNKTAMESSPVFDESYTLRNKNLSPEQKKEMFEKLYNCIGFVE